MIRKFTLAFVLVLAVLVIAPVRAQEGGELKCSLEDTSAALQTAADLIASVQGQDVAAQYAATVDIRAALTALDSACLGLDFEGSANLVSDIVYVPKGVYRVTVVTDGYFIMDFLLLDGDCKATSYAGLFNVSSGEASTGAQSAFKSDGCSLIWQIENVTMPYKVTFEKLK
jgi:hypothetical protein